MGGRVLEYQVGGGTRPRRRRDPGLGWFDTPWGWYETRKGWYETPQQNETLKCRKCNWLSENKVRHLTDRYRLIEADFSSEFMSLVNEAAREGWRVVAANRDMNRTGYSAILEHRSPAPTPSPADDVRFKDVPPPGLA